MRDLKSLQIEKHWSSHLMTTEISPSSVQAVLEDTSLPPETLALKIRVHQQRIIDTITRFGNNAPFLADGLYLDYMLLALSQLKIGSRQEALQTCTDYYSFFGGNERFSTVFKSILLFCDSNRSAPSASEKISIIVPLYNQGVFLHETIPSILNQTYTNFEVFIIDDGSTDNSFTLAKDIAAAHPDQPMHVLTQPNTGKGCTRNRGVSLATGKYVCILDADDMLASTYLEEAVGLLEANPETGWITPLTLQFGRVHQIFYHFDFDLAELLTICPSPVSSVFRREIWDEVGGFDQTMTDREDWEFWIKAAEAGWTSLHTSIPQFLYRIQEKRFGERDDVNVNSKLEIIERHPWWFKPLTREQLLPYCSEYSTCNLNPNILDAKCVAQMMHTPKNRTQRKAVFGKIKSRWAAQRNPNLDQKVSAQTISYLRLARHYAEKGDQAKAAFYRAAAEQTK